MVRLPAYLLGTGVPALLRCGTPHSHRGCSSHTLRGQASRGSESASDAGRQARARPRASDPPTLGAGTRVLESTLPDRFF